MNTHIVSCSVSAFGVHFTGLERIVATREQAVRATVRLLLSKLCVSAVFTGFQLSRCWTLISHNTNCFPN